jgi:hypothetical protein
MLPLFLHESGRVFHPTARHLWDTVMDGAFELMGADPGSETPGLLAELRRLAAEHGREAYDALVREHTERLDRQRETREYAVAARRRALERIGLPAVRAHRLRQLEAEEDAWRRGHHAARTAVPELDPLVVVRVVPSTS